MALAKWLTAFCTIVILAGCGQSEDEKYVSSLQKSLKDPSPKMRYWAVKSLGELGPEAKDDVPAIIEALSDSDSMVRMGAAYALAEIGPDASAATPALNSALNDQNEKVRKAAAHALKKIAAKN